jgi:3-hydroxypropanoate dehydrogenase
MFAIWTDLWHRVGAPTLQSMVTTSHALDAASLGRLFHEGRTFRTWTDRPVTDAMIHELYALTRMPPTSANSQPARFVFVRSPEAKQRLAPALWPANLERTLAAPVTAIVAYDIRFHEKMSELFPAVPGMGATFASMPDAVRDGFLLQNASLEAAYLILAARSLGLDTGPMGGFDKAKVDAEFFADGTWRSTLLINLGFGDVAGLHPRSPRLAFADAVRVL